MTGLVPKPIPTKLVHGLNHKLYHGGLDRKHKLYIITFFAVVFYDIISIWFGISCCIISICADATHDIISVCAETMLMTPAFSI